MLLWIFVVSLCCMLAYAVLSLFSAYHFHFSKPTQDPTYFPRVSVLIPARNESSQIEACIHSVLQQTYPSDKFEVLCIDDASTDDTLLKIERLSKQYPKLRALRLTPDSGGALGKKAALSKGIEQARGEILLQTDADCILPSGWINTMVSCFSPQIGMVAGPVGLTYQESLFQKLQALEIAGLGILTGGSIAGGSPHMCNGANLAYRKSLFEKVGGYRGIDHFASGDDELLMQKVKKDNAYRIQFCPFPQAIVRTSALLTWKEFTAQRIRWVSKAKYYWDKRINAIQLISYLAFTGMAFFFLLAWWNPLYWSYFLLLFLLKMVVDIPLMYQAVRFFGEKPLLWLLPLLECVYIPYVLWIGIAGNFSRTFTWKNRTVS